MKGILCATLLVLCTLAGFGQANNTRIWGKIVDGVTKAAVPYATVTVKDKATQKIVNGAIADEKGAFEVKNIPFGTYEINVDFMGYKKEIVTNVVVSATVKAVNLNNIFMHSSQQQLQSVTITGKAPIVENKIDKIVYNAQNDITAQGGVAIDVLKKVPQVTVDADGNVELQGNSNVRFLINGKPSSIFGNSLADALAAIPASQIKSIEAITNPGAKYDAQGTGGIINIILKDNRLQGVNGSVNLSAGTRLENGSVNLNMRKGDFGMNAYFSGNAQLTSRTPSKNDRTTTNPNDQTATRLVQDGYSNMQRSGYQGGLGFDWSMTKHDNINGNIGYNSFGSNNEGITKQLQSLYDAKGDLLSEQGSERNSRSKFRMQSLDWNLNYKKTFEKKDQELNVIYSASYGTPFSNYAQQQTYNNAANPYIGSRSENPGIDLEHNISIDYTQPIGEKFVLETGVKTILQSINSEADVFTLNTTSNDYVLDNTQSYNIHYKRNIYAGYVSGAFNLFNFLDVKAGARFEHTDTKIDFPNTSIPAYNSLVPSIVFAYKINETQGVKLAYSRRIERPDYREINPFVNMRDPYNFSTGNPLLKPEIGNNMELGYNRSFNKGGNVYVGVFARFNQDDMKDYTNFYATYTVGDSTYHDVSVSTRLNIGEERRVGLTLSGNVPIGKLNLRSNVFVSSRRSVNILEASQVTTGIDTRFNMNASYQLPKDLIFEAFGFYRAASQNVQGRQPQYLSYTFGMRKQFWDKKASIGLTATNPFTPYYKQTSTVRTTNYVAINTREVPYNSFGISFSYKFGKLEFKKGHEDSGFGNGGGMGGE
ncbi:outer membrane receptor protein involved in Fe transport [Chitinophaga skermanii]|uniref:Outer membrane receptor protein involved in Fe transport n=1 Tax=Chitinophaga skermanii TaxID=331697 RepID=A0A327QRC0_9BACT|nr:TonB-dependent receptor [Chitinophaga skermanii]RAJ06578.1 outer membrane receptor protein involved in Fe transport [Chitinophaga skermanii]